MACSQVGAWCRPARLQRRRRAGEGPYERDRRSQGARARRLRGAATATGTKRGDKVQVIHGAFAGHLAVLEGMKPRARVEVLMTLLGTQRRAELPKRMCGRPDQQIAVCKRSEQRSGLAVSGRLKRAANHGQHHGYILGRSKFSCDLNDDSGRVSGHRPSSRLCPNSGLAFYDVTSSHGQAPAPLQPDVTESETVPACPHRHIAPQFRSYT